MNAYVIIKPVITEKSLQMARETNSYTFYVDPRADKREIRQAIQIAYGVEVIDLKTIRLPGKVKRTGKKRSSTKQADRKKAIAVLPQGQKIEVFDL